MKPWGLRTALIIFLGASAAWLHGEAPSPQKGNPALVGIWERVDLKDPELLRYYFFHPKGIGLYRYGKDTLNHTEIFEYDTRGDTLHLRFKKSRQRVAVPFSVERINGQAWLKLKEDPRERRRAVRYRLRPRPGRSLRAPSGHPFARTWIRHVPQGFRMYQFQPPNDAGQGRGWFHHGDFDEWTTESLAYQRSGDVLRLRFDETRQTETTPIREVRRGGQRVLELERDPRNFWHHQVLRDAGPSFMSSEEALQFFLDRNR